ncbi:GT-D fold domain-containing glycosyltransferase [Bacillus sp. JJ1532]|uniref:GT-D fold domain-containing glycosyltransferase n=1 Tax=Bacillus sp. JJ1532 TaxID=3122958 RepID=UPI003F689C78
MNGKSIGFQSYSDQLSNRLKDIIISQQKDHIVCIPNVFNEPSWFNERAKTFWANYIRIYIYERT